MAKISNQRLQVRGAALTPLGVEDVKRELPEIFGPGPTLGKVGGVVE